MNCLKVTGTVLAGSLILGIFSIGGIQAEALAAGKAAAPETKGALEEPQSQKNSDVKVTFVELGSVNCIPCKAMQPVMKEIEQEYGDQVKVVFHDVWTNEGKAYGRKYKIQAIPTQVFLDRNGNEYFRHMGFFPKEEIVKVLEKQGVKKTVTEKKPAR
jgi:thioredoxin 1